MHSFLRSALTVSVAVLIAVAVTTLPSRAGDTADLESRINKLEKQVSKLQSKLKYMRIDNQTINGLAGPHVLFEGCNLYVRDGSGRTFNEEPRPSDASTKALPIPQELGNLVIGYNEEPATVEPDRGGSHNLIVGPGHNYPTIGCVVFGQENVVSGLSSTVTGGLLNEATSDATVVSAGRKNIASGVCASVTGGEENTASGNFASISGGKTNDAVGTHASVTGGSVNKAAATFSSVTGGYENLADANSSTVSGGNLRGASNEFDWVAGSLTEDD